MILIRDGKEVYNRVTRPAVVFDRETGTLMKIGEWEVMEEYFHKTQDEYRAVGYHEIADDVLLMELPNDQEIVDKVFQNTGYLKVLYTEATDKK